MFPSFFFFLFFWIFFVFVFLMLDFSFSQIFYSLHISGFLLADAFYFWLHFCICFLVLIKPLSSFSPLSITFLYIFFFFFQPNRFYFFLSTFFPFFLLFFTFSPISLLRFLNIVTYSQEMANTAISIMDVSLFSLIFLASSYFLILEFSFSHVFSGYYLFFTYFFFHLSDTYYCWLQFCRFSSFFFNCQLFLLSLLNCNLFSYFPLFNLIVFLSSFYPFFLFYYFSNL